MAMVCPQCNGAHEQRLECPTCAVRLVFREQAQGPSTNSLPNGWQQTAWGRILIGLLLAQGVFHGLKHLCVAGLLVSEAAGQEDLWAGMPGYLLLFSLQIIGVTVGGLLAGAGQRQGAVFGAVLGVWNGVLLLVMHPDVPEELAGCTSLGLPLAQGVLGALAGWLGGRIWSPLTPAAGLGAGRQILKTARKQHRKLFAGPVVWVRVVLGTSLAVAGALSASVLLDKLIQVSAYNLSPESQLHAQIVTWEISALAVLLGGTLAGATTLNGLKQGLVVGVLTSVLLVGIRLASPNPPSFFILAGSMFGPVVLAMMGGGFGSQLLPPLAATSRKRSFETI